MNNNRFVQKTVRMLALAGAAAGALALMGAGVAMSQTSDPPARSGTPVMGSDTPYVGKVVGQTTYIFDNDHGWVGPKMDGPPRINGVPLKYPAFPMTGLEGGEVDMPTYDGHIKAYRVYPKGKLKGAPVIMFQPMIVGECGPAHQDEVRRLAARGFYVIMPNMLQRKHPDACHDIFDDGDPNGHSIVHDMVAFPDDAQQLQDAKAAFAFAAKEGASRTNIGFFGYDGGGRTAYKMAAHYPELKAVVSDSGPVESNYFITIHPLTESHPSPVELAGDLHGKLLGFYGGKDGQTPAYRLQHMIDALKKAGDTKSQIVVYPAAGHGFLTDFDQTADSRDAWDKMVAWFHSHGVVYEGGHAKKKS